MCYSSSSDNCSSDHGGALFWSSGYTKSCYFAGQNSHRFSYRYHSRFSDKPPRIITSDYICGCQNYILHQLNLLFYLLYITGKFILILWYVLYLYISCIFYILVVFDGNSLNHFPLYPGIHHIACFSANSVTNVIFSEWLHML